VLEHRGRARWPSLVGRPGASLVESAGFLGASG
jgi:hypothetical protein